VFLHCIISLRCLKTSFKNDLDGNPLAAEQSFRDIFEHIEKRPSCNIIVNYTIAYDILKHLKLVLRLFRNEMLSRTGFCNL
jgi:hypothetical protein